MVKNGTNYDFKNISRFFVPFFFSSSLLTSSNFFIEMPKPIGLFPLNDVSMKDAILKNQLIVSDVELSFGPRGKYC